MRRKAQGGRPVRAVKRCAAGRFIAEARVKRSRKTTGAPEEPPRKSKKEQR